MKVERLLTPEEIRQVLADAQELGRFLELEKIIFQHTTWTDIVWLSPFHEMIFIYGNDDTGFMHINHRHLFYQEHVFWKEDKPDRPSQFKRNTTPFNDYSEIAEALYSNGEKNKKKRPHFDNYIGKFKHEDGDEFEYVLVTYENTKIVHTIYPKKQIGNFKSPENFLWHRGEVTVRQTISIEAIKFEVIIPYIDKSGIARYSVKINYADGKEKLMVLVHKPEEKRTGNTKILLERDSQIKTDGDTLRRFYQYADLFKIEKFIIKLHNHLNKKD